MLLPSRRRPFAALLFAAAAVLLAANGAAAQPPPAAPPRLSTRAAATVEPSLTPQDGALPPDRAAAGAQVVGPAVERLPPCSLWDVLAAAPSASIYLRVAQATDGFPQMLRDPNLQATVFVPTDRAWAGLLRALNRTQEWLLVESERDALRAVMQYSVVPGGPLTLDQLRGMEYLARLPTMYNGQPLRVYTEWRFIKLAATSRQIGYVIDPANPLPAPVPEFNPLGGGGASSSSTSPLFPQPASCQGRPTGAISFFVNAVLPPNPQWQDDMAALPVAPPPQQAAQQVQRQPQPEAPEPVPQDPASPLPADVPATMLLPGTEKPPPPVLPSEASPAAQAAQPPPQEDVGDASNATAAAAPPTAPEAASGAPPLMAELPLPPAQLTLPQNASVAPPPADEALQLPPLEVPTLPADASVELLPAAAPTPEQPVSPGQPAEQQAEQAAPIEQPANAPLDLVYLPTTTSGEQPVQAYNSPR